MSTRDWLHRYQGHHIDVKGYPPGVEDLSERDIVITRAVERTQTGLQLRFVKVSWDDYSTEKRPPTAGHNFHVRHRTIDLRNFDEVPEQNPGSLVASAGPSAHQG